MARIHISPERNLKLKANKFGEPGALKTRGIWYGIDNSWLQWCITNRFNLEALKYKYTFEIDESNLKIIETYDDLCAFNKCYSKPVYQKFKLFNIGLAFYYTSL